MTVQSRLLAIGAGEQTRRRRTANGKVAAAHQSGAMVTSEVARLPESRTGARLRSMRHELPFRYDASVSRTWSGGQNAGNARTPP